MKSRPIVENHSANCKVIDIYSIFQRVRRRAAQALKSPNLLSETHDNPRGQSPDRRTPPHRQRHRQRVEDNGRCAPVEGRRTEDEGRILHIFAVQQVGATVFAANPYPPSSVIRPPSSVIRPPLLSSVLRPSSSVLLYSSSANLRRPAAATLPCQEFQERGGFEVGFYLEFSESIP